MSLQYWPLGFSDSPSYAALFDGYYESIEAVSSALDADKTWTLTVVSGD